MIAFPFSSISAEFLRGDWVKMSDLSGKLHSIKLLDCNLVGESNKNLLYYLYLQESNTRMIAQLRAKRDNKSIVAEPFSLECYDLLNNDYRNILSSYKKSVGSEHCHYTYLRDLMNNNSFMPPKPAVENSKSKNNLVENTKDSEIEQEKIKLDLNTICKIYYLSISEARKSVGIDDYVSDYEFLRDEDKNMLKDLVTFVFKSKTKNIFDIHSKFLEIKYDNGWEYAEEYDDWKKVDPEVSATPSKFQTFQYLFLSNLPNSFEIKW